MQRRHFLAGAAAIPGLAATAQSAPSAASDTAGPFVGVQLGPQSVFDEGPERCLDLLKETAAVNAVFVYSHTYTGQPARRTLQNLATDHGVAPRDPRTRKLPLVWVQTHDEFYRDTFLRHADAPPDSEFRGKDVFETLAEPARKRGIRVFARILEGHSRDALEAVPGWNRIETVDVYGKRTLYPCWNHPAYRGWWLGTVEDLFKSYPLAGLKWGAERSGPLSNVLMSGMPPFCFCEHCLAKGRSQDIRVERAREGFLQLHRFVMAARHASRPPDGVFISLLRLLGRYPEILAWEQLWHDSKESLKEEMYGTIKGLNPQASVGWHIYHWVTWDPPYRAMTDYGKMAAHSDWIKPVVYHDVAGPRIKASFVDAYTQGILREFTPDAVAEGLYSILGYDRNKEPKYAELAKRGLSPDYVYRETKRCVDDVAGQCAVYPGVGFDVPAQAAPSDPETVYQATREAFHAGAKGLIICREYDEMRLPNLRAAGRAIREAAKA